MKTTWWMLALLLAAALTMTMGCDDGGDDGCEGGLFDCSGVCVNLQTDHANCGGCGNACMSDQTCVSGACQSGPTDEICNNLDDDQNGIVDDGLSRSCDNPCGTGTETCASGTWGACTAPEPTTEICDELDNDCDGQVDEDVTNTYYRDEDEDLHGTPDDTIQACEAPDGYVEDNTDCNDAEATVNPTGTEDCDGVLDENCDGTIDEGCACTLGTPRECGEGGDTGECEWGSQNCIDEGDGPVWADCEGGVRPADEICDGLDNDCDDAVDDGMPADGYEANNDCVSARGPFEVVQDGETVTLNGTLYSTDGTTQDEDWFQIVAVEDTDWFCGIPWIDDECAYYFEATLEPPADATHTDWEMCLYVHEDDDCGVAATSEFCVNPTDHWDDTTGRYSILLRWEGVCAADDGIEYRVVVRPAGSATVQDCAEYEATFSLIYLEEECTG